MAGNVHPVSTMSGSETGSSPGPLWDFPPPAHEDEDPASIIVRVAEDHFFRTTDLFALYFQRTPELLSDVGNHPLILEQVHTLAGYGADFLRSLSWNRVPGKKVLFRGQALPSDWIGEGRRVAPGVLANDGDNPYIRLSWRFPAMPFDLKTTEMLIERCPSCFSPLTWRRCRSVCHCQNCQYDLREVRPVHAVHEAVLPVRRLAAHIGLLPGEKIALPRIFDTEDTASTLKVLEWAAWFGGLCRLDATIATASNASRGIEVAESWPVYLELAADLLFRQDRAEGIELRALQPALKKLPEPQMTAEAMKQLAQIMLRPDFQKRDRLYRERRWKYFNVG